MFDPIKLFVNNSKPSIKDQSMTAHSRHPDHPIVIKLGGSVAASDRVHPVAADIATLCQCSTRVLVVHGGGPQATAMQKRLGQEPNIVAGRRITDADALEVMKMVVGGSINIALCSALIAAGAKPVGLNGASSQAVAAVKRPPRVVSGGGPEPIDFGCVGDVVGINLELINLLLSNSYVPVLACLGADNSGTIYNINADIIANQAAVHLEAHQLVLITSVRGVYADPSDPSTRIGKLTAEQARNAIADGTIAGGMIPKIEESLRILESGLQSIHIVGELNTGELLAELTQPGSIGTALVR